MAPACGEPCGEPCGEVGTIRAFQRDRNPAPPTSWKAGKPAGETQDSRGPILACVRVFCNFGPLVCLCVFSWLFGRIQSWNLKGLFHSCLTELQILRNRCLVKSCFLRKKWMWVFQGWKGKKMLPMKGSLSLKPCFSQLWRRK